MRTLLRKALTDSGVEFVAEAAHGKQALERIAEHGAFDVELVDWNMPEMNGFELLVELRSRPEFASMLIMFVTTETEASQIMRALDAGADEYLIKPFSREALHQKLQ